MADPKPKAAPPPNDDAWRETAQKTNENLDRIATSLESLLGEQALERLANSLHKAATKKPLQRIADIVEKALFVLEKLE